MSEEIVPNGVASLGERGIAASFAALLSVTTDAVLIFDGNGSVLLANEEASRVFGTRSEGLVGTDVRLLFVPAATVDACEGPVTESLPFALDGSTTSISLPAGGTSSGVLFVRCMPLRLSFAAYLLVAHCGGGETGDGERERLFEELSRSNRRLSGTLRIVLGTLDSLDVGTLFSRVLEEITETMDAWATLAYVAESTGYRVRGKTKALEDAPLPAFMPNNHQLVELAAREGSAVRLRVAPPTREELRRGDLATRSVVLEQTGTAIEVATEQLPPFPSFVLVPVWFGESMIALLEVGWRHAHKLRDDDTRLLDAVSEYLSVQLAGAFAAMRAQHADQMAALGTSLRERLLTIGELTRETVMPLLEDAAEGLFAELIPLEGNQYQPVTMGMFPEAGSLNVPVDMTALVNDAQVPRVARTSEFEGLESWLANHTHANRGLLVVLGMLDEVPYGFLLLRDEEDEPFEDVDISFVRRFAEDIREVLAGTRARARDKHIAEALQRGMRNELQHVDGLLAQSRYFSATEAAFVGGDFFDLIRLPQGRACMIMGDVSGKGVEAASVSSAVKTALGAYSWEGLSPARMVRLLNDFLLGFSRIETFATMFVGMVDVNTGELVYCSAGHPPALLVRASSGELVMLGVQSGVVGAFEDMVYQDGYDTLQSGDMLLLYTDGVTEARNRDGAFFGEDGLRQMVSREAQLGFEGLCDRLIESLRGFAGHALDDDVALVALQLNTEDANA